ncbi:hypothetical protein [Vibrio sp. OPT18]|uniref:hypothetical protein n=1 Tax=Vibrio sp. OPT18 TaxID=2778641 RepID=UPI001D14DF2F|nr:hypothetical protein [Vibrio sp. OPT18]
MQLIHLVMPLSCNSLLKSIWEYCTVKKANKISHLINSVLKVDKTGKGMFEPRSVGMDELKLAVSLPGLDFVSNGIYIPPDDIVGSPLLTSSLDALFVSGLIPEKNRELAGACVAIDLELFVFENPSNDSIAIRDVVLNITDKLFSDEMPDNLDIADIRELNQSSDYLLAFNNKYSALDFMETQGLGTLVGGVYLAHCNTDLDEYETVNKQLSCYMSDYGFLCSSFHSSGHSDCTILLCINSKK